MSQRKVPHPRDNVGRSETPPISLICSNCRTFNGVRYLCVFCVGFPPVAVCQQCKEAPSYFRHIWACQEGIPDAMPRAGLPPDGPSSSPNVSSTAIDMPTQAPSSDNGTTLSSQVDEGSAVQPNVGTTTMRTSASEGRLITFTNMEVGEIVRETFASPDIAIFHRSHTHVASSVVDNSGCNNEVRQLKARWKSKKEDPHFISGEWVLGSDKIYIKLAKKVTPHNGICICHWPGTNKKQIKCEWRLVAVNTWDCDWLPFMYLSILDEWVEHDDTSSPPLNEMGLLNVKPSMEMTRSGHHSIWIIISYASPTVMKNIVTDSVTTMNIVMNVGTVIKVIRIIHPLSHAYPLRLNHQEGKVREMPSMSLLDTDYTKLITSHTWIPSTRTALLLYIRTISRWG